MAKRPVFYSIDNKPYYREEYIDFKFYPGFSYAQKQKSIRSLHEQYQICHPDRKALETSSKSNNPLGVALSAFNLKITTSLRSFSVECAFQGSKVFENGGPYVDLLNASSHEAKKDIRLRESGKIIGFNYFGIEFPLEPKDYFYNWLYINALSKNEELAIDILDYDSFTDIEFNPEKSINCQAKAAAIYVGLCKQKQISTALLSRMDFLNTVYGEGIYNTDYFV